jgi:type I restriction enzyme M protein
LAQDIKSGAGQYFTPRPLIQAMVDVMAPRPGQTICDPAAGTGGFLIAAHDYIAAHHGPLDRDQWRHLNHEPVHGWEIVDNAARLCVMNLYLRGIGSATLTAGGANGGRSPIHVGDSLAADPGERTNVSFTLKQNPLTRADLDEFVACYNPANRYDRTPTWSDEPAPGAGSDGR